MRAYRRILISNGMMNIPAKVSSISTSETISLTNTCSSCQGDVGKKNYCKGCGKEPANDELLKAYKESKDSKFILTKEQIKLLKDTETKVDIKGTMFKEQLDPRMLATSTNSYLIWADEKAKKSKPLAMILAGMWNTNKVLVCDCSLSGKSKPAILKAETIEGKQCLLLQLMNYAEYLNPIDETIDANLSDEEIKLASDFIDRQLKPMDIKTMEDPYSKVMEEILKGKPLETIVKATKTEDDLAFFKGGE